MKRMKRQIESIAEAKKIIRTRASNFAAKEFFNTFEAEIDEEGDVWNLPGMADAEQLKKFATWIHWWS